jgi:hypothetical protein
MTKFELIAVAGGTLIMGLLAGSSGWTAAGEREIRATPQQPPVAAGTPPRSAPAETRTDDRAAQRGAPPKADKPLLSFFTIRDRARSVVYAIDCSGSMATRNSLEVAKRELLTSLRQLPPDTQFAVIFYNLAARVLIDDQGNKGLMAASASNLKRVQSQIAKIEPDGGTDHAVALRRALALKPEVIVFLTDGDLLSNFEVEELLWQMGRTPKQGADSTTKHMAALLGLLDGFSQPYKTQQTRIHAVRFGRGPEADSRTPLRRLANSTGGSYVYLDVSQFPRVHSE